MRVRPRLRGANFDGRGACESALASFNAWQKGAKMILTTGPSEFLLPHLADSRASAVERSCGRARIVVTFGFMLRGCRFFSETQICWIAGAVALFWIGCSTAPKAPPPSSAQEEPFVPTGRAHESLTRLADLAIERGKGQPQVWKAVEGIYHLRIRHDKDRAKIRATLQMALKEGGEWGWRVVDPLEPALGAAMENLTAFVGSGGWAGFDVRLEKGGRMMVFQMRPGSSAALAGVRPGWVVRSINGKEVESLLEPLRHDIRDPLYPLSCRNLTLAHLVGELDGEVTVEFLDGNDEPIEKTIRLEKDPEMRMKEAVGVLVSNDNLFAAAAGGGEPAETYRFGVVRTNSPAGRPATVVAFDKWVGEVDKLVQDQLRRMRRTDGLVLDLRGNTSGSPDMVRLVCSLLFGERTLLGAFVLEDKETPFEAEPYLFSRGFRGPVAILTDELSVRYAEMFTIGLQSVGRARVFGKQTPGESFVMDVTVLPNGMVVLQDQIQYLSSRGELLTGKGVVPDESVEVDRESLNAGRDLALEAALAWLDKTP